MLLGPVPRWPAIFVLPTLLRDEPKRTCWAEVERIEGARSHAIKEAAEGLLVGGVLGASTAFLLLAHMSEQNPEALGYLPFGLLVGDFTGSTIANRTKWTRLYP